MKHVINTWIYWTLLAVLFLTACDKTDYIPEKPTVPGTPTQPPHQGVETIPLRVKVAIKIGAVVYDSIPATLHITSFDSTGKTTNQIVELAPGTNTLTLNGKAAKYTLRMAQWGLSDEITLTRAELATKGVIQLGASRAARLLKSEANFYVTSGGTRPKDITEYRYDGAGRLIRAIYHEQRLDINQMDFLWVDKYVYEGGKLDRIERYDAKVDTSIVPASFTAFNYDAQGRIAEMYQNGVRETAVQIAYSKENQFDMANLYYYIKESSGASEMRTYLKYLGGNKVEESGRSYSGTERGTFQYDFNINPFAHMNLVDLYLSHTSKNNVVDISRSSGVLGSNDPYKFEYTYNMEGYPVELLRSYKASGTGEHRYAVQTMFTY
jgi:hypothetical protein